MAHEQYHDRRKLLVLVGCDDQKFADLAWYSQWESDEYDAAVMTVLPFGDFRSYFVPAIANNETHLLCRVNANRWTSAISQ
jgi:hypothetical protein